MKVYILHDDYQSDGESDSNITVCATEEVALRRLEEAKAYLLVLFEEDSGIKLTVDQLLDGLTGYNEGSNENPIVPIRDHVYEADWTIDNRSRGLTISNYYRYWDLWIEETEVVEQ